MPDKYNKTRNNWIATNRDRIGLIVDKGKKEVIRSHAESKGESLNAFINRAIDETISRDNRQEGQPDSPTAGEAAPAPADPAEETETETV